MPFKFFFRCAFGGKKMWKKRKNLITVASCLCLIRSFILLLSRRCFATHPSPWLFQLVPANDCDPFNLACDEGPSNSPQSLLKQKKSSKWKQCCCHGYLLAASSVYRKPPQWTALAVPNLQPGWEGWSCLETRRGLSSTEPRLLAGERATKGAAQTQCCLLWPGAGRALYDLTTARDCHMFVGLLDRSIRGRAKRSELRWASVGGQIGPLANWSPWQNMSKDCKWSIAGDC